MVSIITACFNSEKYLSQAIESVINQEYEDWEMIIVDDCSSDSSFDIAQWYADKYPRIKAFRLSFPSGSPTVPRNKAIELAQGRFISFLDSDDLWFPNKLSLQIPLFANENVAIVYSDYAKISEEGVSYGKVIKASSIHSYDTLLCGNELGCLTVIYDVQKIGKRYFKKIGHEDYNLWLEILREGFIAYNGNSCLALYRVRRNSVSSNKLRIVKWIWHIYREEQKIGFFYSLYYLFFDLLKSFLKYLK